MPEKPAIAITMGDPCGIGPEEVVKALSDQHVYATCRPIVIGNVSAMEAAVRSLHSTMTVVEPIDVSVAGSVSSSIDVVDIHNLNPEDITVGKISIPCGKAAMEWVQRAVPVRRVCVTVSV